MTLRHFLLAATALCGPLSPAFAGDLTFVPVPAPADDAAKRAVVVSASATMDGTMVPLGYTVLARTGDMIGGTMFAGLTDNAGKGVGAFASNSPDFTSLLPVGKKLFSLTHFEDLPGAMYLSELTQDGAGKLTAISTKPVDFSTVGGLWNPCAGSVTPWNTHLGSEEYPTDARAHEAAASLGDIDKEVLGMARYFGLDPETMTLDQYRAAVDPYRYGFPVEVTVTEDGGATPVKHGAMGRVAVELANVMPDRKTAYITDDGTNTGLFRFVADRADDLSAGSLYAAKWVQTSDQNGGAATIQWIDLGHADDATVRAAIEAGTRFSDLFDVAEFNADGTCPDGFLSSNAEGRAECLKVKAGMQALASRLETRRVASMLGATTEFRKMEGSVYNPDRNSLYVAMSDVSKGMTDADEKADKGGRNDIRLPKNACGTVFELALGADYAGTTMTGILSGKPTEYPADSPWAGQTCDIDGIANPDNITYIPGLNTLIVGEDTGEGHQNDAIWAMNLATSDLVRIATTPYGAEATSVDWYPNLNGHAYLVAVVQHPYGESDQDKQTDATEARGYVGYIGPFPAMK